MASDNQTDFERAWRDFSGTWQGGGADLFYHSAVLQMQSDLMGMDSASEELTRLIQTTASALSTIEARIDLDD